MSQQNTRDETIASASNTAAEASPMGKVMVEPPSDTESHGLLRTLDAPVEGVRAPLIGRGPETALLEEIALKALTNKAASSVLITGGAGIGKTRLIAEFVASFGARERKTRVFRVAARDKEAGLSPSGLVERALRMRFDIDGATSEVEQQASVRKAVSDVLGGERVEEVLRFLGGFVGVAFPDSAFTRAMEEDPDQFTRASRTVLRHFLEADASQSPLVFVFDDLHNATDGAIELIDYLVSSLGAAPVLLVLSGRPELLSRHPDFAMSALESKPPRCTRIEVGPLSRDDAERMLAQLLSPTGEPPDELIDAGVEIAGGSPYLIEQTIRMFIQNGAVVVRPGGKSWDVDLSMLDEGQLPLTVEDAIASRIAGLGRAERELLEMAATMGGVFWLGALTALGRMDLPPPEIWGGRDDHRLQNRDILASLEQRDYVLALPDSTIQSDREYAFKHNLEREALYRLTPLSRVRQYHRVIAEWLEFRLAERGEEQCSVLAHHQEQGGLTHKAGEYYVRAGDLARARYANAKACEYYQSGLALLDNEDVVRRIDALHHFGDVLQIQGRNDEALKAFQQMLELAFRLDLRAKGGAAHNRIGRLHRTVGRLEEAMRHLGTGLALFDSVGDERGIASSLDDVGRVHGLRGAYQTAEDFYTRALTKRRLLGDKRSLGLSLHNLGELYHERGRFSEALAHMNEALQIRRDIADRHGIARTLNRLGTIHDDAAGKGSDADAASSRKRAFELWAEALEVARLVGDRMSEAIILTNLGEAEYRRQKPADALRILGQVEEIAAGLGDRLLEGEVLRGLAKTHLALGDLTKARDLVARSLTLFEQARARKFVGVALRSVGEILASASWGGAEHQNALDAFEQSISLFTELGNDIELARTCDAYAIVLREGPSRDVARAGELERTSQAIRARAKASDRPPPPSEDETGKFNRDDVWGAEPPPSVR